MGWRRDGGPAHEFDELKREGEDVSACHLGDGDWVCNG
jgi:hypothetical protein